MKKGFSFLELLVVVAIIPILALIGLKYFGDQRKQSYQNATKNSMTELMSLMHMARENDGHYHQFIYQMGYKPKGSLIANLGVKASNSAPCDSSKYPALKTDPCSKLKSSNVSEFTILKTQRCPYGTNNKSGNFEGGVCMDSTCECESGTLYESYRYYNCNNTALGKATDTLTICGDSTYAYKCNFKGGDPPKIDASTSFDSCNSKAVCDHDKIGLGAISETFSEKMVLHSSGEFCMD